MLCAKNLKVASRSHPRGCWPSGCRTAHALIDLNSASTGDTIHQPQYFAAEKLAAENSPLVGCCEVPADRDSYGYLNELRL